jgi:hypothetical protein
MNLTSSLLVLALLGMDDPTSKPGLAPKASAEMTRKADGETAAKTTQPDRILQGKLLTSRAEPRITNGAEAAEAWPMTLQSAMRIGLDNSEIVRVIAFGAQGIPIGGFEPTSLKAGASVSTRDTRPAPIVIARLNADADPSRFKAEVMAHVRSVEQEYWVLAFTQVQLRAAEQAVRLAQEVLNREEAQLQVCHGTVADVAEAAQRLEQFKLDLVNRTSDVITAERQLRFILGLPPVDNRRIIPVTPAPEARLGLCGIRAWTRCWSSRRTSFRGRRQSESSGMRSRSQARMEPSARPTHRRASTGRTSRRTTRALNRNGSRTSCCPCEGRTS